MTATATPSPPGAVLDEDGWPEELRRLGAAAARLCARTDDQCDYYNGTRDELIAAGVVPDCMFPGDPGMARGYVTIWPMDAVVGREWKPTGRLDVNRLPTGRFIAGLVVSKAEAQRRQAEREAAAETRRLADEAEERIDAAEQRAGASLDAIIATLGLSEVRAHVERLHRESQPRRRRTPVWSTLGALRTQTAPWGAASR